MKKEQFIFDKKLEKETLMNLENSANTILSMSKNEYDYETSRSRAFDTRSGIFIGFIGTILVFLMSQSLSIHSELNSHILFGKAILITLSGFFLFLAIIGFLTSMYFFMETMSIARYARIPSNIPKDFLAKRNLHIMETYIDLLSKSCSIYHKLNEKRAHHFQRGYHLAYISIVLTFFSYAFILAKSLIFGV